MIKLRSDLADVHRATRESLSSAGTWWSARARRALADTAVRAMWASDPLPPWATNEAVAGFVSPGGLDDAQIGRAHV